MGKKRGKYKIKVKNPTWFKNQGKKKTVNCLMCGKEMKIFSCTNRKYCSKSCYHGSRLGIKRPEHAEKLRGRPSKCKGIKKSMEWRLSVSGENSPSWKGGVTTLYHKIRRLPESDKWRLAVYERDNFTCTKCMKNGVRLECHHLKQFSTILKDNDITTLNKAINCKELWDISNGQTLCKECHKLTDNYGKNENPN